jgi:hypothetical protein
MQQTSPVVWPSKWERLGLIFLAALTIVFGALVVKRAAFSSRRMGDLGCYLRGAWAVRTGNDLYAVTDNNKWHYNYPPLLAILLAPLADPPPGADTAGMLPYWVSVALWYLAGVLCAALAVHWTACALEQGSSDPAVREQPWGCQRWWLLRVLPFLICLPAIGHTLMRGQVNLLVLAVLCGMLACLARGWRLGGGLCLAGAICLKIIPGFLLLYPVWRRDGRCLAGVALGLVVGLGVIPVAVFGPAKAVEHYQTLAQTVLGPGLGSGGGDQTRAKELIEVTSTDSQSFQSILHNSFYLDRSTRPHHSDGWMRKAHWLIGGLLTLLTLWAAGWRRRDSGPSLILFLGALMTLMVLVSPVSHLHYFCLSLPLLSALLALDWERRGEPRLVSGITGLLLVYGIANVLPQLPGLEMTRDVGLAMYAALLLWLAACIALWKQAPCPEIQALERREVTGLAA